MTATKQTHGPFGGRKRPKKTEWRIEADAKKHADESALDWTLPGDPTVLWGANGIAHEVDGEIILDPIVDVQDYTGTGSPTNDGLIPDHSILDGNGHGHIDDTTKFLVDSGFMGLRDEGTGFFKEQKPHYHDLFQLLPEDLRDNLTKMLDPRKRKEMLTDIYKGKVFVASYWMIAIFMILLFLPESRFYAPFIAGYVGGRKAGSVWKGMLAASMPFILLGFMGLLVQYQIVHNFYDIYLPSAGLISNNIGLFLVDYGLDPSGIEGSFYDPGASLSMCFIYMIISAIIGGTLEGDARKLSRDTAEWVNDSNISKQLSEKKIL